MLLGNSAQWDGFAMPALAYGRRSCLCPSRLTVSNDGPEVGRDWPRRRRTPINVPAHQLDGPSRASCLRPLNENIGAFSTKPLASAIAIPLAPPGMTATFTLKLSHETSPFRLRLWVVRGAPANLDLGLCAASGVDAEARTSWCE